MSWHVQEPTIDAYVHGRIDDAAAFSLEAHVLACAECREALATRADPERLERMWGGVRAAIDRPRERLAERALLRLGVREDLARLISTTPALRGSWVLSVGVALAFAVLASRTIAGDALPFLALAPLMPIAGVAVAFGRRADPAWELGLSSPTGAFALMMIRTTAVLGVSLFLAALAALALPHLGWTAAAWLLPALTLTALTLLSTSLGLSEPAAAGTVGAAWLAFVLLADRLADQPLAAFHAAGQIVFALLALAAGGAFIARHASVDRPGRI